MANSNLTNAKRAKNDEFYTQFHDIEKEIAAYIEYNPDVFKDKTVLLPCDDPEWSNFTKFFAQNFERFGLKKLISTSYAVESKTYKYGYQPTLFEESAPQYNKSKTVKNGKIFSLTHDKNSNGKIDVNDLNWKYLDGDGDFKSIEVQKLRNEADMIITNPPFSMFREFVEWVMDVNKQFLMIGSINAITYKEIFNLIKEDNVWLGVTGYSTDMVFAVPKGVEVDEKDRQKAANLGYVGNFTRLGNSCWFTNLEHGRRHQPLPLMTEADIVKFGAKKPFEEYDNYHAIEVPYVKYIPNDYNGVMGVPISFIDKYCPEQFEIIGSDNYVKEGLLPELVKSDWNGKLDRGYVNNKRLYSRILIKHKIERI